MKNNLSKNHQKEEIEGVLKHLLFDLENDFEIRRSAFLKSLNENLDILLDNTEEWFGDEIPQNFKNVVKSLMFLSSSYNEQHVKLEDLFFKKKVDKIELKVFLKVIVERINILFHFVDIETAFEVDENYFIFAPEDSLRNAFITIFLCFYNFFSEDSSVSVGIGKNEFSVILKIKFLNLTDGFPGADKIKNSFFPIMDGSNYTVGVGIRNALDIISNSGGVYKESYIRKGEFEISITYPTIEFSKIIDNIKEEEAINKPAVKRKGSLVFLLSDAIIEMVLHDSLSDVGYTIINFKLSNLDYLSNSNEFEILITDSNFIKDNFLNMNIFYYYTKKIKKIIVICNENDDISTYKREGLFALKKPLTVDKIISFL